MKTFLTCLAATLISLSAGAAWAQKSTRPTDPQIAALVDTANQIDIDAGKLAKSTSQSKDVQQFAQQMITDHSAVNKSASELATKLKVIPELSIASAKLQKGGDDNIAALKKLQGHAFDQAYVDHEVAYHEAVIKMLDKILIPDAKNTELKALLVKVRPAFEAHLAHARKLQAELARGAA